MPEWHLHLASVDDPLAQRMGAEMAMALADLIRAGELPAQDLRGTGPATSGADRPVPQPLADVLRYRQLWKPAARRGLPGASSE